MVFVALFLALAAISCTTTPGETSTGTLQGKVHIGPLSPVEIPGVKPPVNPEVFAARKVMVYDKDGRKLISQVDIKQINQSNEGFYSVPLKPGIYVVDINRLGIDFGRELPRQIEIKPGQTVELNIDIDTGIR